MIWNDVCLAVQLRNPERMNDISRMKRQPNRPSNRNDKFVGCDNRSISFKIWDPVFPPPLMCNHIHIQRACWRFGQFHFSNGSQSRKRKYKHDDRRNDRPCKFDGIAAKDLDRFARITCALAKADDGPDQDPFNDHEYCRTNSKNEPCNLTDFMRGRAYRMKNIQIPCIDIVA